MSYATLGIQDREQHAMHIRQRVIELDAYQISTDIGEDTCDNDNGNTGTLRITTMVMISVWHPKGVIPFSAFPA